MEQKFEAVHGGLGTKYQTIFYLITPTRVGKTSQSIWQLIQVWKHPHACGEDQPLPGLTSPILETPPRVWGRLSNLWCEIISIGNTPTRVGKTIPQAVSKILLRKHPHACGEDLVWDEKNNEPRETPPRVWGRQKNL